MVHSYDQSIQYSHLRFGPEAPGVSRVGLLFAHSKEWAKRYKSILYYALVLYARAHNTFAYNTGVLYAYIIQYDIICV